MMPTDNRVINMSNFFEYQAFSDGYGWMTYDHELMIRSSIAEKGFIDTLNNTDIWNRIGSDVFNMPYLNDNGDWKFVIPTFSDISEADIGRKEIIGRMIKKLIISPENNLYFNSNSKFILYNTKIEAEEIDAIEDANTINIIFNVISLFLLQTLKTGMA